MQALYQKREGTDEGHSRYECLRLGCLLQRAALQILQAWRDGKIQLIVSPEILGEYRRVTEILAEGYPGINAESLIDLVVQEAAILAAPALRKKICDDPDDDKFLACALASKSKTIVSGDKHLLKVSGYKGIEVLKPRNFLEKYLAQQP